MRYIRDVKTYFTDLFGVDPAVLEKHGAFNLSLVTDLPLFIDPFLLFNSKKKRYRELHDSIIRYLTFLRDKAQDGGINPALLNAWYRFPEVKQNWFGFSLSGNEGTGLGADFAVALHSNLHRLFPDFGQEEVTKGSHLEKLCLISDGVGKDNISDFTTNLIKDFLCQYTQEFAQKYLHDDQRRQVPVSKVVFNYDTESWEIRRFELPWTGTDYVLLTPKDILTKDETWINKSDLVDDFESIPNAILDATLRAQVNNYFAKVLVRREDKEPTKKDLTEAARRTILEFPKLIDYYIRYKEEHGDEAEDISSSKIRFSEYFYIAQIKELQATLLKHSNFYDVAGNTYEEARRRLGFLKDVIENKGGHRIFYAEGRPIHRESDLHIMYRLVWIGTPSDVSREVNDGRGPADFKVSRGARDKTIIEFKLAKNTQLERNLVKQTEIYRKASDAQKTIKAIVFFSDAEYERVHRILVRLDLRSDPDIILIDGREDNKPSGSKA
jgi:hypothetical protein